MNQVRKIILSAQHLAYALSVGDARQDSAEAKRSVSAFPEDYAGQYRDNHRNASCAELAASQALNIQTSLGCDVYNVPDLDGTCIDVRWSRHKDKCKVKQRDIDNDRIIVSVTGNYHENMWHVQGWLYASEAPIIGNSSDPHDGKPPCWFINSNSYRDLTTLTSNIYKL